jgi:hypothetical protein
MNCPAGNSADFRYGIWGFIRKDKPDKPDTGPFHKIRFAKQRQNDRIPYDIIAEIAVACDPE